jgi:hypothetical protein
MEGPETTEPGPGWRRDLTLLGLLLVLAVAARAWVVFSTEVPARDSIGFIRYTLWFEKIGWSATINHQHQHPAYPLCVLAASGPVRHLLGAGRECAAMQLSAQLVSALAGILLVFPMYFLGKVLLDRAAGFWGTLLFQCLPVSGHVLSDAVSDPLFLLLLSVALLGAVLAVRHRSPALFALAGAGTGLAYLTRPEGALVLPAAGLALLGLQLVPSWRQPWRRLLACGAALTLAALAFGSPYYLTTGSFTRKPSFHKIEGMPLDEDTARGKAGGPLLASLWGVHIHDEDDPLARKMRLGAEAVAGEVILCYQYVWWLPALVGVWWYAGRYRRMPESWVVLALFVLDALVLWWLAVKVAYVSERHVLVLVLCSIFQAVAVVREAPYRLAAWWCRRAPVAARWGSAPAWSLILLLALTGTGLAKTLRPLHGNRAGHRAAGQWLAEHAIQADVIDDDHCWAHYYAGWVFLEGEPVTCPAGYHPLRYFVLNRNSTDKLPSHPRSWLTEPRLRELGARLVYHWPDGLPAEKARVVIYALPEDTARQLTNPQLAGHGKV